MTLAQQVGSGLRRERERVGKSLAELAAASGVSKSTLHALEQGEGNPTLSTLWSLATALAVPLGDLLKDRPTAVDVVRAGEGPQVVGDGVHARLLHRLPVRGTVELYDVTVSSEGKTSPPHRPGVQECLVVTDGQVTVGPAGSAVQLAEGDSIYFDGDSPHQYFSNADSGSRGLLLMIYT